MKKQLLICICLAMVMLLCVACSAVGVNPVPGNKTVKAVSTVEGVRLDADGAQLSLDSIAAEAGISDTDVVSVIVEFGGKSLYEQYLDDGKFGSFAAFASSEEGKALLCDITKVQDEFGAAASALGISMEYKYRYSTLSTAVALKTEYRNVKKLQELEMVRDISFDVQYAAPDVQVSVESLLSETGVFANNTGYDGTGRLISVIDTGLDWKHEAFTVMPEVSVLQYSDIEALAPYFSFNEEGEYTADDLYINGKVGFGFDYADIDTDVIPSPIGVLYVGLSHGTHVAGTAAGNAESGFKGVAYNAQLAIMKVFGDYGGGGYTSDIVAAASDAMLLGADTINMSLGSVMGFTKEESSSMLFVNEIYGLIDRAGVNIVTSAGNSYNTGLRSYTGANYTWNPEIGTIGAPGSYATSWAVASVETQKVPYMLSGDGLQVFISEAANASSYYMDFFGDFYAKNPEGTYEYVVVPGNGEDADYEGLDLTGKIALVQRGGTTFTDKAIKARDHGAIAIVVRNNQPGSITMSITEDVGIAICSVSQTVGIQLVEASVKTFEIKKSNGVGPYMSDFSSWGTLADLTIKPEISGFGGDVYAPVPQSSGVLYESMSGTSMAAPNVTGVTTIVRQYIKERYPYYTEKQVQNLAYQLIMSTATTVLDEAGNPAFVRKQGAGLANLDNAVNTKAYLSVTGSNRTKLELGDDPDEAGVYTLRFNLVNISEEALSYDIVTKTFTESVAANGYNVAYLAHMLDEGKVEITAKNAKLDGTTITVEGGNTAVIKIKITLSEDEKDYIRYYFENGYYVEGFVQFASRNEDEIDLSIPWLAFFGDFTKAPIFESLYWEEDSVYHFGRVTPLLSYGKNQAIVAGIYPYNLPAGAEEVEFDEGNIAMSAYSYSTNGIYSIYLYSLRNIKLLEYIITDDITGEVLWEGYALNVRKTFYYTNTGKVVFAYHGLSLNPVELGLSNNQTIRMTVRGTLDFWREATEEFSFPIFVDFEDPMLWDDAETKTVEERKILSVKIYDNHRIQNYQLFTYDAENNAIGSRLTSYPVPMYTWNQGENNVVDIDVTDYLEAVKASGNTYICVYFQDWALNSGAWIFDLSEFIEQEPEQPEQPEEPGEGEEGGDANALRNVVNAQIYPPYDKATPTEDFDMSEDGTIVYAYKGTAEEVVVPEGVIFIAPEAFKDNKTLKRVVLPTTIKAIGDKAFFGAEALTEVVILSDKAPRLYDLYDANYAKLGWFYQNFVGHIDYVEGLTLVHKADASFDSFLWSYYFTNHKILLEDGTVSPENPA